MNIVQDMERLELIECVMEYGFAVGSEILWIHKFKNLPENRHKSRNEIGCEMVDLLRIPKCSLSTFTNRYVLYNKLLPRLMSSDIKEKIEMFDQKRGEHDGQK